MARTFEPTPEQEAEWKAWVAERPDAVRAIAERFSPWTLYRLKTTGQRVTIHSFLERDDGRVALTVTVSGEYNLVTFERNVFGIDADDLAECDLPSPDEATGAAMTSDDVEDNIDALRVMVRPDLWEMGADGKAHRKDN